MRALFCLLLAAVVACGNMTPSGDITAVNTPAGGGLAGGSNVGAANLVIDPCGSVGDVREWDGSAWSCAPNAIGSGSAVGDLLGPDGDKGDITVGGTGTTLTIDNDAVTLAKLANVATATILGRTTAGTGDPQALTGTQATTLLDTFTSSLKGLVPASGGGTTTFLRADGTFATPPGTGITGTITSGDLIVATGSSTVGNFAGSSPSACSAGQVVTRVVSAATGAITLTCTAIGTAGGTTGTGTAGTVPIWSSTTGLGNSSISDSLTTLTTTDSWLTVGASGAAVIQLGVDTDSTTNARNGWKLNAFSDGDLYLDEKVYSGGHAHYRIGAGTSAGTANEWLTIDGTGAATFPKAVSLGSTLDLGSHQIHNVADPSSSGDAVTLNYLTAHNGAVKCSITPSPTSGTIATLSLTSGCSYFEVGVTGTATIQGIDATGIADGQPIYLHFPQGINVTIAHESTGATTTNRIRLIGASNNTLQGTTNGAGALEQCIYDGGSINRWECENVGGGRFVTLSTDGTFSATGASTVNAFTSNGVATFNGPTAGTPLIVSRTATAQTTAQDGADITNSTTWNTTAAARTTYGLNTTCGNSISSGANDLNSICGYFTNTSSGAHINAWALYVDAGNVELNHTSGTTQIDGATSINSTLNVTGLVDLTGQSVYLGRQVFTSGGTYTPTTGTRKVLVRECGGGGGSGGAKGGAAGGGAGGSYFEKWINVGGTVTGGTVTIGAAGTAGAATPTNGGNGGDTSVVIQSTTYTAKGGLGSVAAGTSGASVGAAGQSGSSSGDVSGFGMPGNMGIATTTSLGVSGTGGSSPFGTGGVGVAYNANNVAGVAGSGYCAGGGGAAGNSGAAGATGTAGIVIIDEYR